MSNYNEGIKCDCCGKTVAEYKRGLLGRKKQVRAEYTEVPHGHFITGINPYHDGVYHVSSFDKRHICEECLKKIGTQLALAPIVRELKAHVERVECGNCVRKTANAATRCKECELRKLLTDTELAVLRVENSL